MSKKYFVIKSDEDGIRLYQLTKDELEEYLIEEGSGFDNCEWSDKIGDLEMGLALIIKGEIVVPTPKTVVKEWELK